MRPHNRYYSALILSALGLSLGLTGCATSGLKEGTAFVHPAPQFVDGVVRIEVPMPSETLLDRISVGSGFLLSSGEGVTCAHVLRGGSKDKPAKALISGREHVVQVVGTNEEMDIAVFRITPPAPNWKVLRRSGELPTIGQPVRVAGFPLPGVIADKLPSITGGIVSGIDRSIICDGESIDGLIQVDAVASDGNSGGPVVTVDGRVIGMVVFAATGPKAEWRGATFALPVKSVESVAQKIIKRAFEENTGASKGYSGSSSVHHLISN